MADNDSIFSWLHHLRLMFPPTSVVLIGAGAGTGPWVQLLERWNVQTAVLVEADEGQFRQLKRHVSQRDGWQFLHELIAPKSGETSFYQNSLAAESGLFGPEQLGAVWPNLTVRNVQNRTALSLADLIKIADIKPNWLFIDCMPAASILAGTERDFEQVEVVIVRVALTDQLSSEAALTAVTGLLQSRGYRFLIKEVSRHPAIGNALYVRDITCIKAALGNSENALQEVQHKLNKLLRDQTTYQNQVAEQAVIIQELQVAKLAFDKGIAQQKVDTDVLVQQLQTSQAELAKQTAAISQYKQEAETNAEQLHKKTESLQQTQEMVIALNKQLEDQQANDELLLAQQKVDTDVLVQQLQTSQAELAKQTAAISQYKQEVEANAEQLREKTSALQEEKNKVEKELKELKIYDVKYGGDANIDNLIKDLSPFFGGRSITYVDVGAYVGDVFSKLNELSLIKIREAHLYEPNPKSYSYLKENTSSSKTQSLHLYNFCLSSDAKEKIFSAAKSMTKVSNVFGTENDENNVFKVKSYRLDDLIDSFTDKHIDFLKIDVEGHEIDVLKGAQNILKNHHADVIYIEVGFNKAGNQQSYFVDVHEFLEQHGYKIFKIYEQKNEWITDSPLLRRCNFAYLSESFASANPYKSTLEINRLKKELAELKKNA